MILAAFSTLAIAEPVLSTDAVTDIHITGVSATSTLARAFQSDPKGTLQTVTAFLKEKAEEESSPDIVTIKFGVGRNSEVAKAFCLNPAAAIRSINTHFWEAEVDAGYPDITTVKLRLDSNSAVAYALSHQQGPTLTMIDDTLKDIQLKEEAIWDAGNGLLDAARYLSGDATLLRLRCEQMKWQWVELLESFAESYNFKAMLYTAQGLSSEQVESALKDAATFLQENRYNNQTVDETGANQASFEELFESTFAKGNVMTFYTLADTARFNTNLRLTYLNFFRHLGIERGEINVNRAKNTLKESVRGAHSASRELLAVVNYLLNVESDEDRAALRRVSSSSKRPIMQYVHAVLNKEQAQAPSQDSVDESMVSLKSTLKINQGN